MAIYIGQFNEEQCRKGEDKAIVQQKRDETGRYLVLYPNDARDFICTPTMEYVPDATIRINDGETIVYLYKVED